MLWEWVALGVLFFLMRQTMSAREDARRLVGVLLTTTVVLAGLGIWQHFVFYPQAVRDYDQKRAELDRLRNEPAPLQEAAARQARIQEIESEWYVQGVPLDGSSRQLYEQRLRSSNEPCGMFALANSFAALLMVGLFAAFPLLRDAWTTRGVARGKFLAVAACTLLIAYCLVLTKSRTAWAGLFAGLLTWE
jgi:O-antigen ligase